MTKEELLKRVIAVIDLMVNGNEFDIRHLFGLTAWLSYPKKEREEIALNFYELVNNELKESVEVVNNEPDFTLRKYKKIG